MARHLLVPFDGSDRSTEALEHALETFTDAEITVLHVLDPSESFLAAGDGGGTVSDVDQAHERRRERADEFLEEAEAVAADRGRTVDTTTRTGPVVETIVDFADENDVDHVVLGSHGRTGASRVLLGSVAERVVRRSPLPVTVV